MHEPAIRRVHAEDWREWRDLRLRALATDPAAFGSAHADWEGAREPRWRERLTGVPINLVAYVDDIATATASLRAVEDGEAELISMWVAPESRGCGIGLALIAAIADEASAAGATRLVLAVREANAPARSLYERAGFVYDGWSSADGDPQPERRMVLTLSA